ncbi:unnamed protein product [Owenia fusiformis]|uniref:C2H2-type domain-containing protein n=1 Tax=Owenia fusiformis TaxID=6347 RepID=A0A8S4PCP7_OWEFU|nr:unnamed protein product [Owenia fusiformis]
MKKRRLTARTTILFPTNGSWNPVITSSDIDTLISNVGRTFTATYPSNGPWAPPMAMNASNVTQEQHYFHCNTCEIKIKHKVSYILHKSLHDTNIPFKCSSCNKIFYDGPTFLQHTCLFYCDYE